MQICDRNMQIKLNISCLRTRAPISILDETCTNVGCLGIMIEEDDDIKDASVTISAEESDRAVADALGDDDEDVLLLC
jgi:hypothetical protein